MDFKNGFVVNWKGLVANGALWRDKRWRKQEEREKEEVIFKWNSTLKI